MINVKIHFKTFFAHPYCYFLIFLIFVRLILTHFIWKTLGPTPPPVCTLESTKFDFGLSLQTLRVQKNWRHDFLQGQLAGIKLVVPSKDKKSRVIIIKTIIIKNLLRELDTPDLHILEACTFFFVNLFRNITETKKLHLLEKHFIGNFVGFAHNAAL